jgi:hypothetical protein
MYKPTGNPPFSTTRRSVQTYKELFNLRHAQLRNVIERIFGVLKKRFPILAVMREYDYEQQVDIVYACIALHNFLARHSGEDEIYLEWDEEFQVEMAEQRQARRRATRHRDGTVEVHSDEEELTTNLTSEQRDRGEKMRERIARRMWRAYCRKTAAERRAEAQRIAQGHYKD